MTAMQAVSRSILVSSCESIYDQDFQKSIDTGETAYHHVAVKSTTTSLPCSASTSRRCALLRMSTGIIAKLSGIQVIQSTEAANNLNEVDRDGQSVESCKL
jgi:hypothetical protein